MSATCYSALGLGNPKYYSWTLASTTIVTYLSHALNDTALPDRLPNRSQLPAQGGRQDAPIQVLSISQFAMQSLEFGNIQQELATT